MSYRVMIRRIQDSTSRGRKTALGATVLVLLAGAGAAYATTGKGSPPPTTTFSGTVVKTATTMIPSQPTNNSSVFAISCPTGYVALSGGYGTDPVSSGLFIASSEAISSSTGVPAPKNDNRWQWIIDNTTGATQPFTGEVVCTVQ